MDKYNLDILQFVLTGNFCNIELGVTKDKLASIGLSPDNWLYGKTIETSGLWRYGNIEFYFDEANRLTSVFSDYVAHKLDGGQKINITNYWLLKRRKITLQRTIDELLHLKLDFNKTLINPGYIKLDLNSGVFFVFDFPNDLSDMHNTWTMTAIGKEARM